MSDDERKGTLYDVANAVDGLVVITRAGLRRAIMSIVACGMLLFASTVMNFVLLSRFSEQSTTLAKCVGQLDTLAVEVANMKATAEKTKEKVDQAAVIEEAKPTLEIRPVASASSGPSSRPQAVVVIRPPRPKTTSSSAVASVDPPTIEIPVKLPDNAQVAKPADVKVDKK